MLLMFLGFFFNDKVQNQGPGNTCKIVQYSFQIPKEDAWSNTLTICWFFALIEETR